MLKAHYHDGQIYNYVLYIYLLCIFFQTIVFAVQSAQLLISMLLVASKYSSSIYLNTDSNLDWLMHVLTVIGRVTTGIPWEDT